MSRQTFSLLSHWTPVFGLFLLTLVFHVCQCTSVKILLKNFPSSTAVLIDGKFQYLSNATSQYFFLLFRSYKGPAYSSWLSWPGSVSSGRGSPERGPPSWNCGSLAYIVAPHWPLICNRCPLFYWKLENHEFGTFSFRSSFALFGPFWFLQQPCHFLKHTFVAIWCSEFSRTFSIRSSVTV